MLNISAIAAQAMFDLFNNCFYAGEMARPEITVSPDGGRGAYGWCSVYEIWQANGRQGVSPHHAHHSRRRHDAAVHGYGAGWQRASLT